MTLARMWRRQLFAASSAALIVPSAMFAALLVLALGGGFSQLGVLGQVFAGPPAPSAGSLGLSGTAAHTAGASPIPVVIPVARTVASRPVAGSGGTRGRVAPPATRTGPPSSGVVSTGGTIAPGGATTQPVVGGTPSSSPPPARPAPVSSSPGPSPSPAPSPTPVDTVVTVVTTVTAQLPAPVGPAVTQTVQSAGSAADTLLSNLP
jgi:hypothetical protein